MKKRPRRIRVLAVTSLPEVVLDVVEARGWEVAVPVASPGGGAGVSASSKPSPQCGEWELAWADSVAALYETVEVRSMQSHQRINHFPEIALLCRKDLLARQLRDIQHALRDTEFFSFLPETWVLPMDLARLQSALSRKLMTLLV